MLSARPPAFALTALLAALLAAVPLAGQTAPEPPEKQTPPTPPAETKIDAAAAEDQEFSLSHGIGTRFVDLASPYVVPGGVLELTITHRFLKAIQDGDSHDLWGLDSGAETAFGLGYGISDRAEISIFRSSFQETFELAGKVLLLDQAKGRPVTASVRLGLDCARREGVEDPTRPFVQVLLVREVGRLALFAAPSYVRDTPRLRNASNLPVGIAFALPHDWIVEAEVVPKNRDLPSSVLAWHLAASKTIGGHIFEILLGNSRATTVDQILGGDFAGGFERRDVRLGFNLIRDFDL
ncbi:MAG TPA: DUF5777 family beta-barrel protein [Thermoanaerobaculia bacterium]|nr:DUF5777 family beta-barrel protein [Thermoanaerobaculia bacterium]